MEEYVSSSIRASAAQHPPTARHSLATSGCSPTTCSTVQFFSQNIPQLESHRHICERRTSPSACDWSTPERTSAACSPSPRRAARWRSEDVPQLGVSTASIASCGVDTGGATVKRVGCEQTYFKYSSTEMSASAAVADAVWKDIESGESKRKEEYYCFPEHYRACYSFFYDIVNRGEQSGCVASASAGTFAFSSMISATWLSV